MSNIEWTDNTWNPVVGCTPVSPGCLNCYAATMANRLGGMGQPQYVGLTVKKTDGHGATRDVFNGTVRTVESQLDKPLRRKKPTTYFIASMGDLFHESVPFEFIDRVFAVMALCPQHTFQVLTKRPERMGEYLSRRELSRAWTPSVRYGDGGNDDCKWKTPCDRVYTIAREMRGREAAPSLIWPLPNVWLGTSAEDQTRLDERVPYLLRCPAAVRFLSCEPLLGRLDLDVAGALPLPYATCQHCGEEHVATGSKPSPCCGADMDAQGTKGGVDWVIVGGESGAHARECDVDAVRSVVRQCKDAGVPVFVKQLGSDPVRSVELGGFPMNLHNPKGGDPAEWPEDLRVREMPRIGTGVA